MVTEIAFDARDAQGYPTFAVCAFETTPISPRRILMIVVSPGKWPIIAPGRATVVS
jgi:hypothetical protein